MEDAALPLRPAQSGYTSAYRIAYALLPIPELSYSVIIRQLWSNCILVFLYRARAPEESALLYTKILQYRIRRNLEIV